MRAMVIEGFGGPEVFAERDMPKPVPGPTQVLVKVHAAAVNPVDYKIRRAGMWAGLQFPAILGWDVSGVVEEAGLAVKDFQVGDEVFYCAEIFGAQGAYAEYHAADASIVARKPANVSHIEAASIPLAGGTAWEAVIARAKLMLGETALVHAAAGGVGSLAVQMAKSAGAYVFGTCRGSNADFVKSLGVDRVIDYKNEDYVEVVNRETDGQGVDFVFDTVGGDTLSKSTGCTKAWGRMVGIAGQSAPLDALRVLGQRGRVVALKLGADGSAGACDGQLWRCAALPTAAVDTTCCGDAFDAGFVHAWLEGCELEECLARGNACGSLVATTPGNSAELLAVDRVGQLAQELLAGEAAVLVEDDLA